VQVIIEMKAAVSERATGTISDAITVSGGGMIGTTQEERTIEIGPPGVYGFDDATVELLGADGSGDALAGSVPAEYTTKLRWKSFFSRMNVLAQSANSDGYTKDVVTHLPVGLIGNPSASVRCTADELATLAPAPLAPQEIASCPTDSQIGVARVQMTGGTQTTGLFNMVPPTALRLSWGSMCWARSYSSVRMCAPAITVWTSSVATRAQQ
jgi:hypothetical protein